jgi:hypothetical protein
MAAAEQDYLLGLDLSTFCCGFCIWNLSENKFETAGHIPLKKHNEWLDKVDKVCYILEEIKDSTNSIKHVVVEDIITKFISGKSNIKTIIKLAGFNYVIQRKCYEIFGVTPDLLNVIRARNLAECKVPRGSNSKEYVLKKVCELHPEVPELLPLMKTKPEFAKEAFDVADAIVVARAAAAERSVNV